MIGPDEGESKREKDDSGQRVDDDSFLSEFPNDFPDESLTTRVKRRDGEKIKVSSRNKRGSQFLTVFYSSTRQWYKQNQTESNSHEMIELEMRDT